MYTKIQVFFDPTVLAFIETVLLGGSSHEVEKVFAEDSGFFPGLRGHTVTSIPFPGFEFKSDEEKQQQPSQEQQIKPRQIQTSPDGSSFRVFDMNEDSMPIVETSANPDRSSVSGMEIMTSSSPNLHQPDNLTKEKVARSEIKDDSEVPVPLMRFISLNNDSTNSAEWPCTSVNFTGLRRPLTDTLLDGDSHVQMSRLRYNNVRSWRPLSTNSFLSYKTGSGMLTITCVYECDCLSGHRHFCELKDYYS